MTPRLLTIEEAAAELGVKKGSLRSAAQRHGLLVRIGRSVRIDADTLGELIEKCRDSAKDPASTDAATPASTSSGTAPGSTQRARETAERLKRLSPGTSRRGTARPDQQRRIG